MFFLQIEEKGVLDFLPCLALHCIVLALVRMYACVEFTHCLSVRTHCANTIIHSPLSFSFFLIVYSL